MASTKLSHPVHILAKVPEPPTPPGAAALVADLTPAQSRAVRTPATPLCVLASAGAGKTRVITRRIAYRVLTGSAQAHHVLALTFTRKAAAELRGRLVDLGLRGGVNAGTFHAIAAAQLRQWWQDRGVRPPTLVTSKGRLIGQLARQRPALAGCDIAEVAGHIEWAKARLIDPPSFTEAAGGRPLPAPATEVAALYQRYQHELTRRGLIDFDDLLGRCAAALEDDAAFAAAQQWRWRHFFVDEFQDLNPLQHRLLRAWLGSGTDLCAVGDPDQAIYGWNGADPRLLGGFRTYWPDAEVISLDDNHRCSPQVVAVGMAVLAGQGRRLRSSRADGPPPEVRSYPSDTAEAHGVAAGLRSTHHRGLAWSQLAVLARTNAQAAVLQPALRHAGIPYRLAGGASLLHQPMVRAAMDSMRRQAHLPLRLVVADLAAEEVGDNGDGDEGMAALVALAGELCRLDPSATAGVFVSWLPAAAGDDDPGRDGAVTISSFHRAKGLEWTAVWVCGLEQGLVPLCHPAGGGVDEEEERRLLYVAVTRAQQELHCSWAQTRSFGARLVRREASPWLPAIEAAAVSSYPLDRADPCVWRERFAHQRRMLAGGPAPGMKAPAAGPGGRRRPGVGGADPLVVAELRAWRGQRARAGGVPAHVILHDRTLEALAALRPVDEEALLTVPGMGPIKAARFGAQLLSLLGAHRTSA